ncbi:MAG: ABC transporter ATP-binding protein [Gemmatimonadota bacterium]
MIAFEDVRKRYGVPFGRSALALDGMSFRVGRGECFAIVGPNGAGKSTILGLILGYLRPTGGTVRVADEEPRLYARATGIGYLPEMVELPGHQRVPEALRRLGILDGLRGAELDRRVRLAIARVGLGEHAAKRIKSLSKGNRQRVGIAQLLLRPRELLLLDEPSVGLDPLWRVRFRDLLRELRTENPRRTILIASHDLHEIERVADRVALIDRGRLRELIDLRRPAVSEVFVRTSGPVPLDRFLPAAVRVEDGYRVSSVAPADLSRALAVFLAAGGVLEALIPQLPSLERTVRKAFERVGGERP